MIGLEHQKLQTELIERMAQYGVILHSSKAEELTFQGTGHKRQASIALPDDITDDNLQDKLEECVSQLKAQFAGQRKGK